MIAAKPTMRATSAPCPDFLSLLTSIQQTAHFAFRHEERGYREELIAEVVANAFLAYVRLVERGLSHIIYPTPLAQYAIKQIRQGRRVGSRLNVRDISSEYAQRSKSLLVERLDRFDERKNEWREVLVEDRKAGPAETAAARLDISHWLRTLPRKKRRIAETLATGENTKMAARKFRVSPGRISQLRRELEHAWQEFQGEVLFA